MFTAKPVLDPGLDKDELLLLLDDIAEIVERYNPDPTHPASKEEAIEADFDWRGMHEELVEVLRSRGYSLDLS
jgi:hypothetical protein